MQSIERRMSSGVIENLRIVGVESQKLKNKFNKNRQQVEEDLESGEIESAIITEHRNIGRNDPCPCGSKIKFKKCCGKRLAANDERIRE